MRGAGGGETLRVLHVEDEVMTQRYVAQLLKQAEFHVTQADTLTRGLWEAERARFDVVLLDLDTGDSSGLETLFTFRQRFPAIPVVVLTGNYPDFGMDAIRMGAEDFLTKSNLDPQELRDVLIYACERCARHINERRKFINEASHTIATPLTPIKLQLDAIRRSMIEHPKTLEYLDAIERNVQRLERELHDFIHTVDEEDGGNDDPTELSANNPLVN